MIILVLHNTIKYLLTTFQTSDQQSTVCYVELRALIEVIEHTRKVR